MEKTPNGSRVTNAELWQALYELQESLTERFTAHEKTHAAILDALNGVNERVADHEDSDHNGGSTVAKSGGVAATVAAVITGILIAIRQVFQ